MQKNMYLARNIYRESGLDNIWNPYFWYMYGICMVYTIHMGSSSICMVYAWYMYGISLDIPYICFIVDIPCISKDMHGISQSIYMTYLCISMVYVFKDIHGISLDILGYP